MADPRPNHDPADTAPVDQRSEPKAFGVAADDYLDEQEADSFPASDPHSDWAGPPT
jgi:hypothetical protein